MSKNKNDITIEEIEKMLRDKQSKISDMENMTNNNRVKLAKINQQLKVQERKLIEIITNISYAQQSIDNLDNFIVNGNQKFTAQINKILLNMRKIRLNLANLIQYN